MDTLQLRAEGPGFMNAHVAGDACCTGRIVDGNKSFPLLHSNWDVSRDIESFLLHLACDSDRISRPQPRPPSCHVTNLPLRVQCDTSTWLGASQKGLIAHPWLQRLRPIYITQIILFTVLLVNDAT